VDFLLRSFIVACPACACRCDAAVVPERQEVLVKGKRERVGHKSKKLAMMPSASLFIALYSAHRIFACILLAAPSNCFLTWTFLFVPTLSLYVSCVSLLRYSSSRSRRKCKLGIVVESMSRNLSSDFGKRHARETLPRQRCAGFIP